jgi:hypothetical protein
MVSLASLTLSAVPASAGPPAAEECVHPDGVNLNQLHSTPERIVTDVCTVVAAGERWAPATGWLTNTSHEAIPAGYVPARPTPIEDFNSKVLTVRYVVDAGTRQQRTYSFSAAEALQTGLTHPPSGLPLTGIVTVLRPLSVGSHTVDIYVTLSTDHWDGFDVDPAFDLIPAGENHWAHYTFEVVPRS